MSFIIKLNRECGFGRTRYVMNMPGVYSLRAADARRFATLAEAMETRDRLYLVGAEIVELDKPEKGKAA